MTKFAGFSPIVVSENIEQLRAIIFDKITKGKSTLFFY